jgi:hypothetical protein
MPATLHPYQYVLNNPVLYTDPSGEFFAEALIGSVIVGAIIGFGYYGVNYLLSDDPCAQWNWTEAALWSGAGAVLGVAAGAVIVGAILTWQALVPTATVLCRDGDCKNEAVAVGRATQNGLYAIRNGIGQGYNSIRAFQNAHGKADPGMNWHHIVNQTRANIQQFGPRAIHNTNNLIKLPSGRGSLHQQVTNFTNSIRPSVTGSSTLRVYQWLQAQTFEFQWKYGIELIMRFGGAQHIISQFGGKGQ